MKTLRQPQVNTKISDNAWRAMRKAANTRGEADSRGKKKKKILQREFLGRHPGEAKYERGVPHAAKSEIRAWNVLLRAARPGLGGK